MLGAANELVDVSDVSVGQDGPLPTVARAKRKACSSLRNATKVPKIDTTYRPMEDENVPQCLSPIGEPELLGDVVRTLIYTQAPASSFCGSTVLPLIRRGFTDHLGQRQCDNDSGMIFN